MLCEPHCSESVVFIPHRWALQILELSRTYLHLNVVRKPTSNCRVCIKQVMNTGPALTSESKTQVKLKQTQEPLLSYQKKALQLTCSIFTCWVPMYASRILYGHSLSHYRECSNELVFIFNEIKKCLGICFNTMQLTPPWLLNVHRQCCWKDHLDLKPLTIDLARL